VQKLEIVRAVNKGRTNNYDIIRICKLYNLIQIGVTITLDDLTANDREILLAISKEIQFKEEQKARLRSMK
jgi:hypothetical protein